MITFRRFLTEMGGWSKTITQGVKLTPALAKAAIATLPRFEKDFNKFLADKGEEPVVIGAPVGSSAYIERDVKNHPDKEYGDIDVLLKIPRIEGISDSKNTSHYNQLLAAFVKEGQPYLYPDDDSTGQNIIVKVGEQYVQIDMVKAFHDISDWTQWRMTPEHNVKGALMGFMYASLAEVLKMSIGSLGVQAKERGGEIVPFKTLKVDKVHTLSTNIGLYALDILKHLYARQSGSLQPKVDPMLLKTPGVTRGDIKIIDIAKSIKGLGKSFELNGMFGKGALKHIKDYDQFISEIAKTYLRKAEEAANATKFNKAETADAIKKAEDTKLMLVNKSKDIVRYLD